jgi:integrase
MAGVTRPQLFRKTNRRIPLRAQDLRAGFVTVKLAMGKSETWVMDRTGHQSSIMLMRYYRKASRKHVEMGLGDFTPLCEAIPELNGN